MIKMGASDFTIHKGEKEEKYQLYVEDYVMSYLKNYRTTDRRKFFFYGERKQKDKTYYIYGAGRQKNISYFDKYELLDEIICHYVMDMPVFSVIEDSETYELAGYYIFYQSNDAMQSYMVEQRKAAEAKSPAKDEAAYAAEIRIKDNKKAETGLQEKAQLKRKDKEKSGNGLMTVQLSAIFVILIAIVINSTNSYSKLKELGMAAIEVFFVMENQDAPENSERSEGTTAPNTGTVDTTLRLEDLDAKFEEENQTAKSAEESNSKSEQEASQAEPKKTESEKNEDDKDGNEENAENVDETATSEQAFSRNVTDYYRIEKGDTLYTISMKIYGDPSKVAEICALNQISDPDHIESGQKILLP